ncbi:Protein of unknown function, partial [Gryllus bimaculatus]
WFCNAVASSCPQVKLAVGAMGGELSLKLPFTLVHSARDKDPLTEPLQELVTLGGAGERSSSSPLKEQQQQSSQEAPAASGPPKKEKRKKTFTKVWVRAGGRLFARPAAHAWLACRGGRAETTQSCEALERTKTSSWRARRSPGVRPEGAAEVKAARARAAASPESAPWAASRCCIPPSAASPKPPPPQPHRSPGPRLSATLVVAEVGTTTVGVVRRDGNCF